MIAAAAAVAGVAVTLTGIPWASSPASGGGTAEAATAGRVAAVNPPRATPKAGESAPTAMDIRRSGVAAYQRGDLTAAFGEFTRAVEANPEDPEALNNLGQVMVRSGRAEEAIALFDRAIQHGGDKWAYHFNRARAYGELKEWSQAVDGYREAARLFPDDYVTQFNLARALQANGDLPGAIQGFERAIQQAPGEPDFHLSHAYALEKAARPSDAAAAYQRFLELQPDAPQAEKIKARMALLTASNP